MRRNMLTNPIIVGTMIGAAVSMYAMSKMSMSQRRKIYKTSRQMDKAACRFMNKFE